MKPGKIIGFTALGALVLSAIPYQFKKDEQTGAFEIRSLLWGWKKAPPAEGEKNAHIAFAIPPSALDDDASEEDDVSTEEAAEEAPAGEPAAE